jgi:arylsulfatase A-like enzyme
MKIRILFIITLAALFLSCQRERTKPNIIFIMADDLGYGELGCYGQELIRTPNLDRLAAEGMRFTRFYSGSPLCAPSRCVLLTGYHTGHAAIRDNKEFGDWTDEEENGQMPLPDSCFTLAESLKTAGYTTAVIGKWGLGGPDTEGVPNRQGFDYFYGYLDQKQAHNYYPTHLWENEIWDTLNNEYFIPHQHFEGDTADLASFDKYKGEEYSLDLMMEKAIQFVRRTSNKPFFLYLPLTIPHLALQVPDKALQEYKGVFPDTAYYGERGYLPHPHPKSAYAAMITYMDRWIGELLNVLKKKKIDKNTIVFFTSDNGATYGRIGGTDTHYFRSNGILKGFKGSLNEGGIRVPLIVKWPKKIKSGTVSDLPTALWDIFPTIEKMAGLEELTKNDGISFLPELRSREPQPLHEYLYWELPSYGGQQAVIKGKWKGLKQEMNKDSLAKLQLYDLELDPMERFDASNRFPDIVSELDSLMQAARIPSKDFPFIE